MSKLREVMLWDFYAKIKVRLNSVAMQTILGGAARVFLATDDYGTEIPENTQGGRVVIVPTQPMWDDSDRRHELKKESFLVRVDFNNFRAPGYNVARAIETAHAEALNLLDMYVPVPVKHMLVAFPIYRHTRPQRMPLWDSERNVHFASAEYRFEAVPLPNVVLVTILPDPAPQLTY